MALVWHRVRSVITWLCD